MNADNTKPYSATYFIAKFEVIADERWHTGQFFGPNDTACVLGFCNAAETEALWELLTHITADTRTRTSHGPSVVNDGLSSRYPQTTPKARVLAALRDCSGASQGITTDSTDEHG